MMEETKTSKQYDRWSKFYDRTFGVLLEARLRRSIEELRLQSGERVLDMGVGTGVTLDHYPADVRVVGLDLSGGMLDQARRKVHEQGMDHVDLVHGDALLPPFAEGCFDHILITHVLSVVSDPVGLLHWASRLVRPGGRIVIVNHFRSNRRVLAALEKALNPLCVKLGWRSDITLAEIVDGSPLELSYQFKLNPMDLWQIAVLSGGGNGNAEAAAGPPAASDEADHAFETREACEGSAAGVG